MLLDWLNTVIEHDPVHELRIPVAGDLLRFLCDSSFDGIAREDRTAVGPSSLRWLCTIYILSLFPHWRPRRQRRHVHTLKVQWPEERFNVGRIIAVSLLSMFSCHMRWLHLKSSCRLSVLLALSYLVWN